MLKTLFKHEMRATSRTFIWLYIAFAAIAVASAVVGPWSPLSAGSYTYSSVGQTTGPFPAFLQMIVMTLYILAIVAMGIVTFVVIILRFYRNLLGDEGYLMMTLPVSREQHILSKLVAAMIWSICSTVIIILSILLFIAVSGNFGGMVELINEIVRMGIPLGRWIALIVLMLIIGMATGVLELYAAMAIGPNLLKNRLGGSILAFIIIQVASQIVAGVIALAWARASDFFGDLGSTIWTSPIAIEGSSVMETVGVADGIINAVLSSSLVGCVVIAVCCWFLTRFMLKKKLNLA